MARFSFPKRSTEEEGLLGEEADLTAEEGERGGGMRRILILLGIGVVLIGGWYLLSPLFLAPPPPPPAPPPVVARPAPQLPQAPPPAPSAPTKEVPALPPAPDKSPAKEEAKPVKPEKEETAGAPRRMAPDIQKPSPPTAPAKPAPPASPKAPPAKAEAKAAPAAVTKYSLQIGAMVRQENALALKQKLDADGFPATIRKGTAFVTRQTVTVGDPTSRREAEELSRRLNVDGFPSELAAVGGKYTPQVGAFFNLDEAIDLARELQKKNYPPKITSKPATTVVFQVRHGGFDSRAAAVKRGEELKSKGYSYTVVRE